MMEIDYDGYTKEELIDDAFSRFIINNPNICDSDNKISENEWYASSRSLRFHVGDLSNGRISESELSKIVKERYGLTISKGPKDALLCGVICVSLIDNEFKFLKISNTNRRGSRKVYYHDIPKGKISDGESPLEASLRETIEETGFDVSKYVHPYPVVTGKKKYIYVAKLPDGIDKKLKLEPLTRGEVGSLGWFPLSELPTVDILKETDEIVSLVESRIRSFM